MTPTDLAEGLIMADLIRGAIKAALIAALCVAIFAFHYFKGRR